MKSNKSKSSKNKNKQRTAPIMQLSKTIDLFNKRSVAYANMSYPAMIYGYSATDLYSFSSGSDLRYLGISQLFTTEFNNFATVYCDYKIISISCVVSPISSSSTITFPMLQIGCDPEDLAPANQTNSTFILRDTNHLFTIRATAPKSLTFTFSGIGTNTNVWRSTSTQPVGSLYIGNNSSTGIFATNPLSYECIFTALVKFANVK